MSEESSPNTVMKDGLYRVITSYLCAGFVIKDGIVVACAPILFPAERWFRTAKWISPITKEDYNVN
jgi:hypothetical protein